MAPYSIKEDFEATTFTVNPEPFNVGGWIGLTFQALICLGLLTMCSSMATSASYANRDVAWGAFFVMLAFCALGVYLPYRSIKKRHLANNLARRPVQIHVCDKDLRTGDCRDPKQLVVSYSQFHRFVLRNALDGQTFVSGGPSACWLVAPALLELAWLSRQAPWQELRRSSRPTRQRSWVNSTP